MTSAKTEKRFERLPLAPSAGCVEIRIRPDKLGVDRGLKPGGFHISGTRSHPASGSRQDTAGTPAPLQTSIEIPARSLETLAQALAHTIGMGLLKQPNKQKLTKR